MNTRNSCKSIWLISVICALLCTQTLHAREQQTITSEKQRFTLSTVATGFRIPWAMAFLPDGELLVTDRGGELYVVSGVTENSTQTEPVAGAPKVLAGGQGGLLDLELHPDYDKNGWIYLSYVSPKQKGESGRGGNTALMRARLKDNQLIDQQLLFKAQPNYSSKRHYGGRIAFDADNHVYLTVGDRGSRDEVQRLDNYLGKVYRLHDDGSVPEDNPFTSVANAVTATWSYGHRNPQGMAVHPETGKLWAHEHGPKGGDELNLIIGGKNYGWPSITYGVNYSGTRITDQQAKEGMEQPVTYWVPSIAPCGMSFVNSDQFPAWRNNILVGSLKFAQVRRLELEGDKVVHEETLLDGIGRVRAIEQGPDGNIYIAVEGPGRIVRLSNG
jgi:glucose/arabinose dehydrogenase